MDEAEKITGIYERKLIRRLLQTDAETNAIHRRFINAMAPVLAKYRALKNGIIIHDPDLQKQIEGQLAIFSKQLKDSILNAQGDAWKLSNEKTDEIFRSYIDKMPQSGKYIYNKKWNAEKNKFDYIKTEKKQIDFFARNIEAFEQFQKRKYEGMGLSERVWKLADGNKEMLETYLENGLSVGRSANQIAQDVQQLLKEPDKLFRRVRNKETGKLELSPKAKEYEPGQGRYRSSYQNAKRLARTETNMAYRSADQERWSRQKFVLGFEVKLSGQHPAPDICDAAAGKYPKEFQFVGWHPNCLCYAVPILLKQDDFIEYLTGNRVKISPVKDIPDTMKTYIADNTEKISGWKNQPFWVRDNFKEGRIENGIDLLGQSKTAAIKNAKYNVTPKSISVAGDHWTIKYFVKGGVDINIHNGIDRKAKDFASVLGCCEYFSKLGKKTEILPKIHPKDIMYPVIFEGIVGTAYEGKSPDFKVDDLFYEHEGFIGNIPKKSFRNMLNRGLKQSSRIVIEECGLTEKYMLHIILTRIKEGQVIDEVWVKSGNKLKLIYKKTVAK